MLDLPQDAKIDTLIGEIQMLDLPQDAMKRYSEGLNTYARLATRCREEIY